MEVNMSTVLSETLTKSSDYTLLSDHLEDEVEKQMKTGHSEQEDNLVSLGELSEVLKLFGMTKKMNRADWEVLAEGGHEEWKNK